MLEQLDENGRRIRRPLGAGVISAHVTEKDLVRLRKGSAELEHRLAHLAFPIRRRAARAHVFGKQSFEQRLRAPFDCNRCSKDCRSEEHTSELQSRGHLVCRLLLEKKKTEPRVV